MTQTDVYISCLHFWRYNQWGGLHQAKMVHQGRKRGPDLVAMNNLRLAKNAKRAERGK